MQENKVQPGISELLTVIVPCFNEEKTVESTLENILAIAPSLPVDVHVLLIDDGSTDATRSKMEALCRRFPGCRIMINPKNLGLGRSVINAYKEIESHSWVTVLPGDNELDFESIHNFMEVRQRYDIVLGYIQNPVVRTFLRRLASYIFTKIVNTLYGFPYRYLNGMKMYRVQCYKGIDVISGGHAFNAELLAKAQLRNPKLRIGEAPFISRGRSVGSSKAFRPTSILRAIWEVYAGHLSVAKYREAVIRKREIADALTIETGSQPAIISIHNFPGENK